MERRPLGRSGVDVTACCLGTMTWGQQNTEAEGHAQLDRAIDRGVDFIDTAELYSIPPRPETAGSTEAIIGSWLAARGGRDRLVIATKIVGRSPMTWFRANGEGTRITRAQIDEAVEASLRRLQTDYIDLYQLHWPDRGLGGFGATGFRDYPDDYAPFDDQLGWLADHVAKGNIRWLGVSNETSWGVMRFLEEAETRGLPRLVSIQNAYSVLNRTFETGLAEIAMREDVGLLAYSPLAQGTLTGKYLAGALPPGSRRALFDRMQRYEKPGAEPAVRAFIALARDHGWDPAQLAIRFADTRAFTTATIIGATSMEQLDTALDAFEQPWTDEIEEALHAHFVAHGSPCP